MNQRPFQRWDPGFRELSAAEYNRALEALEQAGNLNAVPGQVVEQGPQGNASYPEDNTIQIQITGGFNPYSWTEVYQTGNNLTNPPKYLTDAYSPVSWTTYVRSGTVSPLSMPAYELNANGGVPKGAVVKATVDMVNSVLVFRYDNRAAFVKVKADYGVGWDFTWPGFNFGAGSPITLSGSSVDNLNFVPGDNISGSDGLGDVITGTVTSYTPAVLPAHASLTFSVGTLTGSGTHDVTFTTTSLATLTNLGTNLYAGNVYDGGMNAIAQILVSDPNGFVPTQGVYYQALSGIGLLTRQLWWINRSGPVVLGVSCSPSNQPLATFGAAL